MKVSDILRVKGNTLYTASPDEPLAGAVSLMAERDIGSLVVMEHGDLVGMLTFREVIQALVKNGGSVGTMLVRTAMDDAPLTCTLETDMDEVRRMMLDRHARYMPVMDRRMLMGVISFYDVAKAVVDSQNFENKMLKAQVQALTGQRRCAPSHFSDRGAAPGRRARLRSRRVVMACRTDNPASPGSRALAATAAGRWSPPPRPPPPCPGCGQCSAPTL